MIRIRHFVLGALPIAALVCGPLFSAQAEHEKSKTPLKDYIERHMISDELPVRDSTTNQLPVRDPSPYDRPGWQPSLGDADLINEFWFDKLTPQIIADDEIEVSDRAYGSRPTYVMEELQATGKTTQRIKVGLDWDANGLLDQFLVLDALCLDRAVKESRGLMQNEEFQVREGKSREFVGIAYDINGDGQYGGYELISRHSLEDNFSMTELPVRNATTPDQTTLMDRDMERLMIGLRAFEEPGYEGDRRFDDR